MATSPYFFQSFRDPATDEPADGGKVHIYAQGSAVHANIWLDAAETVPAPNPLTLDPAGVVQQYFVTDGQALDYKVFTSDGRIIVTALNVTANGNSSGGEGGPFLPLAGEKRVTGWVAFDATVYGTLIDMSVFNLTQSGLELKTGTRVYGGGSLSVESSAYFYDPRALTLSIDSMGSGPGGVTPVNSTHLVGRDPVTGLLVPVELDLSGSYIPIPQKAAANGVATLGVDGKVPVGQVNRLSSALDAYDYLIQARIFGDANYRFAINSRGDLIWANGSGNAGPYIEQSASSELHVGNAYVRAHGFRADGGLVSEILLADGTKAVLPYVASPATESDPYVRIIGFLGTTTNDSAPAGCVGELLSSIVAIGAHVSLVTVVAKDVTTLELPAGDWDVWAALVIDIGSGPQTIFPGHHGSVSLTANTLDPIFSGACPQTNGVGPINIAPAHRPVSVAAGATVTVHMVARSAFSSSSCYAYGNLYARRVR